TTELLLGCGASIQEINCVRKHLSTLKGGGLARLVAPRKLLTLVLSDVVGDPLDVIASGPTVPDPTSFAEAMAVVDRYQLLQRLPAAVRQRLEQGCAGHIPETPKPRESCFAGQVVQLVGSNAQSLAAAAAAAMRLGYTPLVLTSSLTGETREVAAVHAAIARELVASGQPLPPPVCLLSGGETTVTLRGSGRGGRNQEFALAAALGIAELADVVILSGGTDGTDGPTDAAGAIVDGSTLHRARQLGLDPARHLQQNDAYPLFAALGDLLITGPTNTNVMDLQLILAGKPTPG
ncbi:MAG: glycerate kinase type-2 family protein, partial [Trichloromonadaceae bacterium]